MKSLTNQKQRAQEIQDKIFRKMSASQKLHLTAKFSDFLLKLNKLNKRNGIPRKNR